MTDWNSRYRSGTHAPAAPHPLLVNTVAALAPGRALDLACGAGRHAIYLARRGWDVTAVDSSIAGIEIARERAEESGVAFETVAADLERGEFVIQPGAYNLICVFYYLQRNLFPSIKAGLKAGGLLVAAIHLEDDGGGASRMNPAFLLKPGELKREFADWKIDFYREGHREGDDHKYCDAEIVARRPDAT